MVNILQILSSVHGGKSVASLASTSAVYLMTVYKDDGRFSFVFRTLLEIQSTMQQLPESIGFSAFEVCMLDIKSGLLLARVSLYVSNSSIWSSYSLTLVNSV